MHAYYVCNNVIVRIFCKLSDYMFGSRTVGRKDDDVYPTTEFGFVIGKFTDLR